MAAENDEKALSPARPAARLVAAVLSATVGLPVQADADYSSETAKCSPTKSWQVGNVTMAPDYFACTGYALCRSRANSTTGLSAQFLEEHKEAIERQLKECDRQALAAAEYRRKSAASAKTESKPKANDAAVARKTSNEAAAARAAADKALDCWSALPPTTNPASTSIEQQVESARAAEATARRNWVAANEADKPALAATLTNAVTALRLKEQQALAYAASVARWNTCQALLTEWRHGRVDRTDSEILKEVIQQGGEGYSFRPFGELSASERYAAMQAERNAAADRKNREDARRRKEFFALANNAPKASTSAPPVPSWSSRQRREAIVLGLGLLALATTLLATWRNRTAILVRCRGMFVTTIRTARILAGRVATVAHRIEEETRPARATVCAQEDDGIATVGSGPTKPSSEPIGPSDGLS